MLVSYYKQGSLEQEVRLQKRLRRDRGGLDPPLALQYAQHMLMGLQELHAAGLLLGGLRPAGVVLDGAGGALLADFGLRRHMLAAAAGEPSLQVSCVRWWRRALCTAGPLGVCLAELQQPDNALQGQRRDVQPVSCATHVLTTRDSIGLHTCCAHAVHMLHGRLTPCTCCAVHVTQPRAAATCPDAGCSRQR